MIDPRIDGKIPLLNDYGSAFFEKGVLLFSLIRFGESYRSCSQDSWFNLTLCSGWKDPFKRFSTLIRIGGAGYRY